MKDTSKEQLVKELQSQLNNFRLLALFIFTMIGFSTWFFHYKEAWSWLDSAYYVVVTLGTVGYGDFSPQTDAGKLYAMALIVVGIASFGFFAQQLIKRQQLRALQRQLRQAEKYKEDLTD